MPDTTTERKEGEGKLLLSLDSGWFESSNIFSQLHVLHEVLHQYEHDKGLPENSVRAHEVFDMIIGTGSGGLLAVMLGSLKMTTREALVALHLIHRFSFNPPESFSTKLIDFIRWLMCKRRKPNTSPTIPTQEILGERFMTAIREVVEQQLGKEGLSMKMQDIEQLIPGCKFAVTAMTPVHIGSPSVFRGYRSRTTSPDCTLVDALRATMANARLFPAVTIGDPISQTYISADAGHPNPIETVLREAETAYRNSSIATILSIGSGRHETITVDGSKDFPEAMVKLASSAHAASERASTQFSRYPEAYRRFNVDQLQPPLTSSAASVEATSRAYLSSEDVTQQLNSLILLMGSRPSTVMVEHISRPEPVGLSQVVKNIPVMISTYDNLKTLSYAERASFNPDLVCLKGTRMHILTVVFKWMLQQGPKASVMWLEGVFGSGKSFIAHSVAVEAHRLGILGSSFFLTPGTGIREGTDQRSFINEPPSLKNIVTSLVVNLGGLSEAFRWAAGELLKEQPRLATATTSVQLTELLFPALSSLPKDRTFLWVIDGFDELMRYPDRDTADRFFRILCQSLQTLPPNFIIFVTSRPLPSHPLPQTSAISLLPLDLLSPENGYDLDIISYSELEQLAASNREFSLPPPGQGLAASFRAKAGGHPLWLRVTREYLRTSFQPNEELEELLKLEGNGLSDFDQLMNSTYARVISLSIDLTNSKNQKALKHVIFVLLSMQRSLPLSTLLEVLDGSAELPSKTFRVVTSHLRPLLLGSDSANPLEFIHLSLRDFFISSATFGDLIQEVSSPRDLSPGHFTLLKGAFRIMETHLRPEDAMEDCPRDHAALTYVAASWPHHITHLNPTIHSSQLANPLSKFLDRSFSVWLEYHASIGLPFLFTLEFLERAKHLASNVWDEKVLSRRQTVEKLDKLQMQFAEGRCFEDLRLCSSHAVELWRLHLGSDGKDQRRLYTSILKKAIAHKELGLTRDALTANQEAINICRSLNHEETEQFRIEDLTGLLTLFSTCLWDAGQYAEAYASAEETVLLRRMLVRKYPGIYETDLALSLVDSTNYLSTFGRHDEALQAIEESISLQRQFLQGRTSDSQDKLALSLNKYSLCLLGAGRHTEVLAANKEAVLLHRQLVHDHPGKFEMDLAMSLEAYSTNLSDAGQEAEALAVIEEAITLRRKTVQNRPGLFEYELAVSLTVFSRILSNTNQHDRAVAATTEAVSLYRQLVQERPRAFEARLASSLRDLSKYLSRTNKRAEALDAIAESVFLYQQLVRDRPIEFEDNFAASVSILSDCIPDTGQHGITFSSITEAILLYRHIVQEHPNKFDTSFACTMLHFFDYLSSINKHVEALVAIKETVSLYRQLVTDRPEEFFEDDLAASLTSLSQCLSDNGQLDEALAPIREAVSLYLRLVEDHPGDFEHDLAASLKAFSSRLSDTSQHDDALKTIREAVSIYQELATDSPGIFEDDLAASLTILSKCLSNIDQYFDSLAAVDEAISLYQQLFDQEQSAVIEKGLQAAIETKAAIQLCISTSE